MPTQAYQVLLVSQNELPEELLAASSGARGACEFAVTRAGCLEEAAARLGAGDTATRAIVLDVTTAVSAADTCRHLKSLGSDLPVVLLTDAEDAAQRETLLAAGVKAVLGPDEARNGGLSEALSAALEERAAAAAAPAPQARLAAALESLGEGVLVADRQERVLLANPAA